MLHDPHCEKRREPDPLLAILVLLAHADPQTQLARLAGVDSPGAGEEGVVLVGVGVNAIVGKGGEGAPLGPAGGVDTEQLHGFRQHRRSITDQ